MPLQDPVARYGDFSFHLKGGEEVAGALPSRAANFARQFSLAALQVSGLWALNFAGRLVREEDCCGRLAWRVGRGGRRAGRHRVASQALTVAGLPLGPGQASRSPLMVDSTLVPP
jgi:hypothetical protein